MDSWTQDGRKFAKFFLLDDTINLNQWRVSPESIPIFMKTFIGQPLAEDLVQEEHFGSEHMETFEILKAQEKYRKGTILDVRYNPKKQEAIAIVEIYDPDLWSRIQSGDSIYVSPAIAGYPERQPDGSNLYRQWFGLHLARVANPAYGVMHAAIQRTCEGQERDCIDQLTSSLAARNISFNPLGYTACELQKMENKSPSEQQAEKNSHKNEMESKMSALDTRLAAMEKSIANIATAMESDHGMDEDDMDMETETSAQYGNKSIGVPSHFSGKEKQKSKGSTASMATLQKQVATLQKQVAMYEEQDKSNMVDQLIGMMIEDDMAMDHERDAMKQQMMQEPKPMLASKLETAQAYHDKLAGSKNSALASTPNRVVSIASTNTDGGAITHAEMRGLMP